MNPWPNQLFLVNAPKRKCNFLEVQKNGKEKGKNKKEKDKKKVRC